MGVLFGCWRCICWVSGYCYDDCSATIIRGRTACLHQLAPHPVYTRKGSEAGNKPPKTGSAHMHMMHGVHIGRVTLGTVSTPNIGLLQTLNQDLRPQQITLPDPTNMFKRPNIWCCYGISVCRRISPYDGSNSSMSAPAVRYATLRCGAHACVFCSHVP